MASQKNLNLVQKLKENLLKSKSIVLTNHTGLTHQQMEKLRKSVKKSGGDYVVIKNTLLKKALTGTSFSDKIEDAILEGPTSILLSMKDELAPIRDLVSSLKELTLLKIKKGALTNKALDENEVIRLALLPTKDVLLAQLLGILKTPQTRLVFALKGNLIKLALVLKAIEKKKNTN